MNEFPLVSVILPVYNVSLYIGDCLDSILSQSYPNLEIIAVNDGTTDDSVEIIENYRKKDNRIKIVHQHNQGLATTRNTGFKYSSGAYIYFMDTDDIIESKLIEDVMTFIQKKNCDIVTFEHIEFSDKLNFGLRSQKLLNDREIYPGNLVLEHYLNLKRNNWVAIWMYFFRRDFLIQSGLQFKEGGINHEDVLFTPQIILKTKRIGYLNHTYYYYRQRPNSITTVPNSFRKKDHFIIANELYENACREFSTENKTLLLRYVVSRYEHIISQIKAQKSIALNSELLEVKNDIKNKKELMPYLNEYIYTHIPKSKLNRKLNVLLELLIILQRRFWNMS
jgi:glycosyltransferase involved in cell wall biosynthesis